MTSLRPRTTLSPRHRQPPCTRPHMPSWKLRMVEVVSEGMPHTASTLHKRAQLTVNKHDEKICISIWYLAVTASQSSHFRDDLRIAKHFAMVPRSHSIAVITFQRWFKNRTRGCGKKDVLYSPIHVKTCHCDVLFLSQPKPTRPPGQEARNCAPFFIRC